MRTVERMQKTLGQERRSQKQVLPRNESFAVLLCLVPQMPRIRCNYCSPLETVNKGSQHFHCACVCVCMCACVRVCVCVCLFVAAPVTHCSSHVIPPPMFGRERSNVIRGMNPI